MRMHCGITFHAKNFHKYLNPHVYDVLKKSFHWEIIHKLSPICKNHEFYSRKLPASYTVFASKLKQTFKY